MSNQLESQREANRITHEVLEACKVFILDSDEITKEEVNTLAQIHITRYLVESAFKGVGGFPDVMCISVNDEVIHGTCGTAKIVKGDLVSLDFGVIVDGYYADAAISFVNNSLIKDPISKKRKLVRETKRALDEAVNNLKLHFPKCKLSNIIHTVEKVAVDNGYGIVLGYTGHGIGKTLHDTRILVPNKWELHQEDQDLKIGSFFTIEPMFTLGSPEVIIGEDKYTIKTKDGSLSAHFEYSIAITKEGVEVLGIKEK
jgi:methionyl aminopeptidase